MYTPYIRSVKLKPEHPLDQNCFPGNVRVFSDLELKFDRPITFFVGENGSGKSTLLEAIAVLAGFPISGGGTNEQGESYGPEEESLLADALLMESVRTPKDGYFFRAEMQAHFASLLERRRSDPYFFNPYARYGGKSLYAMSHGEAFLSVMTHRFQDGLFLIDEPESALSPQRQLSLLTILYDLARTGKTQFIIATHSAILLTYPGARIISFDEDRLKAVELEETKHYQITKGILNSPGSYWKHLKKSASEDVRD